MYRIFNIVLDSQIPIPELTQTTESTDANVFTFSLMKEKLDDTNIEWFHNWHFPDGSISLSVGRRGDDYWLRILGKLDFKVCLKDQSICFYNEPELPESTIRHLLLDNVIPRTLGQMGRLVLHAGAVTLVNGKTIAFIGQSGWGKSTLVSSFQQQGARLITDDCLIIEMCNGSVSVTPNYYGVRLFDDSITVIYGEEQQHAGDVAYYSSKRRLDLSDNESKSHSNTSMQLDAIFLLTDPKDNKSADQINISKTGGMDAMMALVAQTFVLDVTDKDLMAKQFRHCGKIFDSEIPCFTLDYPRDHNRLDDVRQAIESVVENSDS